MPALQRAQACPALTLTKRRSVPPAEDGSATIQRQAESSPLPMLTASAFRGGTSPQVVQREADAAAPEAASAPDAEGGKAGTPEAGQDVNLLAHEVWSILKARIGYEAERMGRR